MAREKADIPQGIEREAPAVKRPLTSSRSRLALLITFLFITLVPLWSTRVLSSEPHVGRLIVSNNSRSLVLFARLEETFNEDVLTALRSGLPFQFDYQVELFRERRLWPDQFISRIKMTHSVKYDILKEHYIFQARYDGKETEKATTSSAEVQRWMNTIGGVEIIPLTTMGPGKRYFLQMRIQVVSAQEFFFRNIFFFFKKKGHYRTDWYRSPLFSITGQNES